MSRKSFDRHLKPHKPQVISFVSLVEDSTLEQAQQLAALPFVHEHVALMPDAHTGLGSSVGTVFGTIDAVIPAAVGVDIGCGMIAALTQFTASDLEGKDLTVLRQALIDAIPMSAGNYNDWELYPTAKKRCSELAELAEKDNVDLSHSKNWRQQLGTLGGGNHFIELCLDELDRVWMFLHSGSRGVGNKIARKHIAKAQKLMHQWWIPLTTNDLAYFVAGTEEFNEYIKELNWAQRFALLNREEMIDRFTDCLATFMGADVEIIQRINCHHNYTTREQHFNRTVWLTRKGAVRADQGRLALIPGSMGTASYVVEGKGNAASMNSAPHGAGRRFSRNEARRRFTLQDLEKRMEGIVYRPGSEWIDEIPDAYKDIDQVMEDSKDLVEIKHKLRQILNVKGT
ncbi:MAG: RtcB family protein [Corynebacterium sp.]|uniref:RtcB family protein n=1 Tax=Corynebacterium sp. TaxID=1720 RepID=UPI0026DA8FAA|nr:RtcB family protein [Corynebacterium sp.]MDO4760525.1 RtcB family protein [Corynebacterium sp.]